MDIRIGIVQSMKELELSLPEDMKQKDVIKEVEAIIGTDKVL